MCDRVTWQEFEAPAIQGATEQSRHVGLTFNYDDHNNDDDDDEDDNYDDGDDDDVAGGTWQEFETRASCNGIESASDENSRKKQVLESIFSRDEKEKEDTSRKATSRILEKDNKNIVCNTEQRR